MRLILCLECKYIQHTLKSLTSKYEPVCEKTNNLGFRPGPIETRLYSRRIWLEA